MYGPVWFSAKLILTLKNREWIHFDLVISCVERVDTRYVNQFMYRYMNHFLV